MAFEPSERKRLDEVLRQAGFSIADFDLELVQVYDLRQPDKSYVPRKEYKVTRKSNGKAHNYTTGAGTVWPDDVAGNLKAGEFGEP